MKVPIRKTLTGTEYWDTAEKKTLFVKKGEKPKFEVTENPESMIGGVDLATGKDLTVTLDGTEAASKLQKVIDKAKEELEKKEPEVTYNVDANDVPNLETMNTGQLVVFAERNGIIVPGNMKKEDTIRKHITDALEATDSK